jgi:hypothetical protein
VAPTDLQGPVWFTDSSGAEEGTEAGVYELRMRLFFSWVKEYVKEGSGKGHLSPYVAPLGNLEGPVSFTGDFERQVIIWRVLLLGTPRDVQEGSRNGHLSC